MRELMNKYSQLTEVQRYQIEALKKAEKSQKEIATIIGVTASTICREFKRNTGQRGYRPKQANIKALIRRKEAVKSVKMTTALITLIETKIKLDWSPEQVAGSIERRKSRSAMSGSINMYGLINLMEVSCINASDKVIKSEKNDMAQRISEASSEIESALMTALRLFHKKHV
jgi:IS30 family transposase